MNKYHVVSLICLILGVVFFAMGYLSGDVETGVFFIFPFISIRYTATVPHAFTFSLEHLIFYSLRGELPFELRESEHYVPEKPAGRGRSIESFGHGDETDIVSFKKFY